MDIGVGLDSRLGLDVGQMLQIGVLAEELGYGSMWTNAGLDYDPIALCVAWHARTGLATGVAVVPIARNAAEVLGLAARTASELAAGRFVLGVGSGGIADRPIKAVRDYIASLRAVAPQVRLAVGALGPQMLRLASTQGTAALNWCTPAQVAWSRDRTGPGTQLIQYLRVAVDDDVARARAALARQILAYALQPRPSGARGYRAHFERMGFAAELEALEKQRTRGAADAELAALVSDRLVAAMGYAGNGAGAREWLAQASVGLDVAVVRVLSARPGDLGPVERALRAFAPRGPA